MEWQWSPSLQEERVLLLRDRYCIVYCSIRVSYKTCVKDINRVCNVLYEQT